MQYRLEILKHKKTIGRGSIDPPPPPPPHLPSYTLVRVSIVARLSVVKVSLLSILL